MNFTPFPTLTTERLILRQQKISDDNEILILRSDPRMLEFIDIPKTETIDDAKKFIEKINNGIKENVWIQWGITLQGNDTLIGSIGFWNIDKEKLIADIGYMLHPDFQGKGIIHEAFAKALDYGFTVMKLKSIIAGVHEKNIKSIKVLEKLGFKYDSPADEENLVLYSLAVNQ